MNKNNNTQKRYQLIAIDKDTNDKIIIKIKNNNKIEEKAPLSVIDFGTSAFNDEVALANRLYKKGELPHSNFKFIIVYKANGLKELPCIFNDKRIHEITNPNAKFLIENKPIDKLRSYLIKEFINLIRNNRNFNIFKTVTIDNRIIKNSGNYVNDRLYNQILDFEKNYLNKHNSRKNDELYVDTMQILDNQLKNYKEFRTLYFYTHILSHQAEIKLEPHEIITPKSKSENSPEYMDQQQALYNSYNYDKASHDERYESTEENLSTNKLKKILLEQAYNNDDMDEFYSTYDLDDIELNHLKKR